MVIQSIPKLLQIILKVKARRVSIEVYDDVIPGDGQMYIVGELKPNYKSIASQIENQDEVTGTLPIDPQFWKSLVIYLMSL